MENTVGAWVVSRYQCRRRERAHGREGQLPEKRSAEVESGQEWKDHLRIQRSKTHKGTAKQATNTSSLLCQQLNHVPGVL